MDAREHLTGVVIDEICAYGAYSDFEIDTPEQIEVGYKRWIGYSDDYAEDEEFETPINPGHCAWRLLMETFGYIDWVRVHQEVMAHLATTIRPERPKTPEWCM